MTLKQSFIEAKDVAKLQFKPFMVALLVLAVVYVMSIFVAPGWATYVITVPPALVVALTALARVNDIGPENMTRRWHVRRIGLIMAGAAAVMVLGAPFSEQGWAITWRGVLFVWGVALAWLTTPEMPPWEDYITGKYREPMPDGSKRRYVREFGGRITGTHKAYRRNDGGGP